MKSINADGGLRKKYDAQRARAFAILWITYGGYYFCRNCYFVAKPAVGEGLGLANSQLGAIDLAFMTMYAAGQFVNGALGDRMSVKLLVGAGMLASVAMTAAFGLSSALPLLLLFWGINGLAQSTGWTSCVKSMDNWFSSRERGTVMGFWSTNFQAVGFVARVVAAAALGWYGWRYSFFIPAAMMFGVALTFIAFHIESPANAGLPSAEEFYGRGRATTGAAARPASANSETARLLRSPALWRMGVSYFCVTFVRYALMCWLAMYLYEKMGFSVTASGFQSAAPELAGLFGTVAAGYVSDRYFKSKRGAVATMMLLCLIFVLGAQNSIAAMGPVWNLAGLCAIYFLIQGPTSIMVGTAAMDIGRGGGTATAVGIINGLGALGAAVQGPVIGFLSDKYGWGFLFQLLMLMSIAPCVLMATVWIEERRR